MQSVTDISARDAAARRENAPPGECILLDVREDKELLICRIEGATHIPMNDIPRRVGEIDPRKEVIVFCHHGRRSYQVAAFLKQQGYPIVRNMAGGIDAWSVEVDPSVPRY
jgi:rhodanese-related sulfurtransferase